MVQQYNNELKRKNRALKSSRANQNSVLEKTRLHAKMMQTFRVECENNKELIKRIRELQNRENHYYFNICCTILWNQFNFQKSS